MKFSFHSKVVKDNQKGNKTVSLQDETGWCVLNLQEGTHVLIRAGAVLRFFSILADSDGLHFSPKTSLVDTAKNSASPKILELSAELETWYGADVLQDCTANETRTSNPILAMVFSVSAVKNFTSSRRLQTVLATDGKVKFEVDIIIFLHSIIHIEFRLRCGMRESTPSAGSLRSQWANGSSSPSTLWTSLKVEIFDFVISLRPLIGPGYISFIFFPNAQFQLRCYWCQALLQLSS